MIDVPFARAARLAVDAPHRAHVVVERDLSVGPIAQRQIERKRDGAAKRIVRDDGVRPIGPVVRAPAVDKRRHAAHLLGRPHQPPRTLRDRLDESGQSARRPGEIQQARALHRQRPVILREPLGQPQLAGHVRAIEIERLERFRTDALDVPAMKELVRDSVEQPAAAVADRRPGRDDRAVAMLHAVAARVRQILGQERVITRFVFRELAVHRALLADDLFDILHEAVELGVGARVMHGESEFGRIHRELADRHRTEFRGAVHQVLKIRRRELERRRSGVQLRGHFPLRTGRLHERQRHRPIVQPMGPHDRRRHVDVRVRRVDGQIRPVDGVPVHFVLHGDAAAMAAAHIPPVRIGPRRLQLAAVPREGVHVVHVLREIVQRVAAGRRAAHPELERHRCKIRERRFHLHPAMLWLGKGQRVVNRRRGMEGNALRRDEDHDEKEALDHRGIPNCQL